MKKFVYSILVLSMLLTACGKKEENDTSITQAVVETSVVEETTQHETLPMPPLNRPAPITHSVQGANDLSDINMNPNVDTLPVMPEATESGETLAGEVAPVETSSLTEYDATEVGVKFRTSLRLYKNPEVTGENAFIDGLSADNFAHMHYLYWLYDEKSDYLLDKENCGISECNEQYDITFQKMSLDTVKKLATFGADEGISEDEAFNEYFADYRNGTVNTDEDGETEYYKVVSIGNHEWYAKTTIDYGSRYKDVSCQMLTIVDDKDVIGFTVEIEDDAEEGRTWAWSIDDADNPPPEDAHDNVELLKIVVTEIAQTFEVK